jgi:hypothetical protein
MSLRKKTGLQTNQLYSLLVHFLVYSTRTRGFSESIIILKEPFRSMPGSPRRHIDIPGRHRSQGSELHPGLIPICRSNHLSALTASLRVEPVRAKFICRKISPLPMIGEVFFIRQLAGSINGLILSLPAFWSPGLC